VPDIAENTSALIELQDVTQEFDGGRVVALRSIDLAVAPGESLAVIGPSGSGKSTIMHVMCGIRRPTAGRVLWKGKPVTSHSQWTALRRSQIGIVFQDFNLFPTLSASENVQMALFGSGLGAAERGRRAEEALAAVGLAARAGHLPHELSGGERQRVAIARAIVNRPSLVLADEPTGNLDSVNSQAIMDLLFELRAAQGSTLVIVTHDPNDAARCRRRIELRDGRIAGPRAPREIVAGGAAG
jgi:putative ABC transport system ATP-binding protein